MNTHSADVDKWASNAVAEMQQFKAADRKTVGMGRAVRQCQRTLRADASAGSTSVVLLSQAAGEPDHDSTCHYVNKHAESIAIRMIISLPAVRRTRQHCGLRVPRQAANPPAEQLRLYCRA